MFLRSVVFPRSGLADDIEVAKAVFGGHEDWRLVVAMAVACRDTSTRKWNIERCRCSAGLCLLELPRLENGRAGKMKDRGELGDGERQLFIFLEDAE